MTIRHALGTLIFGLLISSCTGGQPANMYMVSPVDLEILDATRAFFADESKWTRGEETQCDVEAPSLTLFCALQKSSLEIIKDFQLRRPALEEVRYAIDSISEIALDQRLIDFNNLETTDINDIYYVLDKARARIEARLAAQQ